MPEPESCFSKRLQAAAAALTGIDADQETINLLHYFGYDGSDNAAAAGRVRMLRAGAAFRRLFRLPMPDAPGLVFFGGEADPADLGWHQPGPSLGGFAGSGLDPQRAFESCVGEGIEYLSQFAQPDDLMQSGTIAAFGKTLDPQGLGFVEAVFSACGVPVDRAISWIPLKRLVDGTASWFPADLCLRRATADFIPPLKLSTGCAAGVTQEAAVLRGMLELVERDAVALWWRGGRRGRAIVADSEAGRRAARLIARVRQGNDIRQTALLDITSDLGVPVVAAFSMRRDGFGVAVGFGARTTLAEAAQAAIFEMCQSELSLHVIAAKRRQSGEAALNQSDLRQHARATMLDGRNCLLLRPEDSVAPEPKTFSCDPAKAILRLLEEHRIVAYSLDLTRPGFGVPVVRVIAPGLQPEPGTIIGNRLARAIKETGGGAKHSGQVILI